MLILLLTADTRIAAHLTAPLAQAGMRLVADWPPHPDGGLTTAANAAGVRRAAVQEPDALVADLDLLAPPQVKTAGSEPPPPLPAAYGSSRFFPPPPPGIPLVLLHAATAMQASRRMRAAGLPATARLLRAPFATGALVTALRAAGLVTPPGRGVLATGVLTKGDMVFDPVTGHTARNFSPLSPHPQERLLLELLLRRAGTVVRRADIARWCLDYATPPSSHAVDVLVSRLRRTLRRASAPGAAGQARLRTIRGVGYRLEAD